MLCSCLGLPRGTAAQLPTAAIAGIVQDTARSPIEGASIEARHIDTGLTYRAISGVTGRYWIRGLPPGAYALTAEALGWRATTIEGLGLQIGRTAVVDPVLTPQAVALEPIVVQVSETGRREQAAAVSFVFDRPRIELLSEETRQFVEVAALAPGVTTGTHTTAGPPPFGSSGTSIGALDRQSQGVLVDGADFTEGMFGNLGGSIPLLAIREFEVIQSPYSASLGRAASGVLSVATRRGTNRFELEGFGRFRHRTLTATGAFEAAKPDFRRLHWGVAAGGPLVRDETHAFFAFERRDQHDFATIRTGGAFPRFEGSFDAPFTDHMVVARLDHRIDAGSELGIRYAGEIGDELIGVGGGRAFEYGRVSTLDMHSVLVTHRLAPHGSWLNELRLHAFDARRGLRRNAPDGPTLVYPSLRFGPHQSEERTGTTRLELRDDLSWIRDSRVGTHRVHVGLQLARVANDTRAVFFDNGFFVFASDTSTAPVRGMVTYDDATVQLDASNWQLGLFVQDDWQISSGLILNLGLRYDVESNGSNQGWVSPFAGELPFVRHEPRPVDRNNLAPRLGIAWSPSTDHALLVRGGFGIFYDDLVAGPLLAFERSSGARTAQILNPGTTDPNALGIDPDTIRPVVFAVGDVDTPSTRQYSIGIVTTLPGGVTLTADGMLIQGRNLLIRRDLNPVDPNRGPRYPRFSTVFQFRTEGRAEARMLLLHATRSFARGWIDVAYTLADRKNTSDGWSAAIPQTHPDSLDLDREWGPAAWDERHRVVGTLSLELPLDLRLAWKTVYASARPFTAITGENDNGDFSFMNDRPPGESRGAYRGPDFFRSDIGIEWRPEIGSRRAALSLHAYNLFNRTNGDPATVVTNVRSPLFGQVQAALPGRQIELGARLRWE